MILVVTGLNIRAFERLVKAVDELARMAPEEEFFIQTGSTQYQPLYCSWSPAVDFLEFEEMVERADVLVSHGGAGAIAGGLERGKPVVVVPRRQEFNEHVNDHQMELTAELETRGRVIAVYDITGLGSAIARAKTFVPAPPVNDGGTVELVRRFLDGLNEVKNAG